MALDLEFEVLRVRAGGVEGARHGLQLGRGPLYLKFFGLLELQGAIIPEGVAELVGENGVPALLRTLASMGLAIDLPPRMLAAVF